MLKETHTIMNVLDIAYLGESSLTEILGVLGQKENPIISTCEITDKHEKIQINTENEETENNGENNFLTKNLEYLLNLEDDLACCYVSSDQILYKTFDEDNEILTYQIRKRHSSTNNNNNSEKVLKIS